MKSVETMAAKECTSMSPKKASQVKSSSIVTYERPPCAGCGAYLQEPFIRCKVCKPPISVCLLCFSHGLTTEKHCTDHSYEVMDYSFPIFESCWTAAEEMRLLEALSDCGVGNWNAIAKQVRTKSPHHCRTHYMNCYIINARYPLPELPKRYIAPSHPPVPFKACEDPCRPLPESHRAQNLSGYLAARGDFGEEFMNSAECAIKDVQFCPGEWPTLKALKVGLVQIYQSRLAERRRRKQIISMHGLMNNAIHQIHYFSRLDADVKLVEDTLRPIMKLTHPIAYDKMMAGISLEKQLIKKVKRLQEFRKMGVTSLSTGRLYEKMKGKRRQQRTFTSNLDKVLSMKNDHQSLVKWLQEQVDENLQSDNQLLHKSRMPIDISTLPGTEKLNNDECNFCSNSRIVPEAFLKYKNILINASKNTGSLKLAQARTLVKIDVNKTRKLYDFLLQQGHITDTA